jgi:NAD+ kinase
MTERAVLLVVHTGRRAAVSAARDLANRLASAGMTVRAPEAEAEALHCDALRAVPTDVNAAVGTEIVVAFGGDGTLLRAAELARPAGAALLGVNLGRVGFLAEADRADLDTTVERILHKSYDVEDRLTLDVEVHRNDAVHARAWALNDVTVEKVARERMLDLLVEVDGRPLSRWAGDGVVCATPTGSTAYAFSAGGPVVWPSVQALLVVPISAHALFARPLVISPDSRIGIDVLAGASGALAFLDGRRTIELDVGDRVEVTRGALPVRLVRLHSAPFTDRLVGKFRLPVRGWRARGEDDPVDD